MRCCGSTLISSEPARRKWRSYISLLYPSDSFLINGWFTRFPGSPSLCILHQRLHLNTYLKVSFLFEWITSPVNYTFIYGVVFTVRQRLEFTTPWLEFSNAQQPYFTEFRCQAVIDTQLLHRYRYIPISRLPRNGFFYQQQG
jgi:hypothetical protein